MENYCFVCRFAVIKFLSTNINNKTDYYVLSISTALILVTLIMEAISSSKLFVLTRATRRNIPEDIFNSHRPENLKPYVALAGWDL
jgi:hypothetical protein